MTFCDIILDVSTPNILISTVKDHHAPNYGCPIADQSDVLCVSAIWPDNTQSTPNSEGSQHVHHLEERVMRLFTRTEQVLTGYASTGSI